MAISAVSAVAAAIQTQAPVRRLETGEEDAARAAKARDAARNPDSVSTRATREEGSRSEETGETRDSGVVRRTSAVEERVPYAGLTMNGDESSRSISMPTPVSGSEASWARVRSASGSRRASGVSAPSSRAASASLTLATFGHGVSRRWFESP